MLQSVIIANQQNGQIVFSHHFNSVLFDRQPEANMEKEYVELCLKSGQKEVSQKQIQASIRNRMFMSVIRATYNEEMMMGYPSFIERKVCS